MFSWFKKKKKYQDLPATDFQGQLAANRDAVILDVRTKDEFKSGHIAGAENLNVMDSSFSKKLAVLDKNKSYYVYCRSGGRSGKACSLMTEQGFNKVYNLDRGIMSWPGKLVQ
jgi:rhodanese-related sulfurtransferase